MTFEDMLNQAVALLQRQGRLTYQTLQLQFHLDDAHLEVLKDQLLYAHAQTVSADDRGLVWTGDSPESAQHIQRVTDSETRFQTLLLAVMQLLQREKRVTYRELKYVLALDEAVVQELRQELFLKRLAHDEDGRVLVWTGEPPSLADHVATPPDHTSLSGTPVVSQQNDPTACADILPTDTPPDESVAVSEPLRSAPEAERRQLTVMFCDLVGSTDLSGKLDPEDLREVVRAYQETAAEVIERYEGHIAQYLGDGLLIYFGFPVAHENDAERAAYSAMGITETLATLNIRLAADYGVQLAVRLGIHTGPVVVGEMGGGGRHENLALGETPNIAARLESLARPNTTVISSVTAQLVRRSFILEELGPHELKGAADPIMLYTVASPRDTDPDDHEEMLAGGFDALVGRDEEIGLLVRRWEQSKDGQGQVVLISGEAGLGKSSLVEGLRAHVHQEGYTRIAFRCSPYTANSALHPVIEHVQRVAGWQREDPVETKLAKLEQSVAGLSFPLEESMPLLAGLLSLPLPAGRYPALALTPQQQRQYTYDTLVAWMLEEAERQPLLAVWEDLHWADPSTLELLGLFMDQAATVPMMNVLAFRPVFVPPWPTPSHLTPLTLHRLERSHIEAMVTRLAGGKGVPAEVTAHIVTKTEGVPLYVEELTKMLLESTLLQEETDAYVLTGSLASASIPATLQDSLMARLDRLPEAREVAQLGAVLGREFAYEMLEALASEDAATLQASLSQLVATALLYQRGRIPRATFIFRHVLIRDAAYESLLRRTRQHHHQHVAQLLEARFPEVVETQPALVAHHYTEAGLIQPAIDYWQRAGQRESERSAYQEAISHVTTGLTLLQTLPETQERHQQELPLQTALGTTSLIIKGHGAPEAEAAYTRARLLCQQLGDTQDVFPVLFGLWRFNITRADFPLARQLGEELLGLAGRRDESPLYVVAHCAVGTTCMWMGALRSAHRHFEEGIARYAQVQQSFPMFRAGQDPGVSCRAFGAWTLWLLGYPDQALAGVRDALALAAELDHPFSNAFAHDVATIVCQVRRTVQEVYDHAEATITFSTEQGFSYFLAQMTLLRGWAFTALGQQEKGLTQMCQGLIDLRATGAEVFTPYFLTLLAEGYGHLNQGNEGLDALQEGVELVERMGAYLWQAEVYRLQGELLLHQAASDVAQAETCFYHALDVSREQHAKSLELRAATSLATLWKQQGKRQDAHDLLAPVYEWFTEGFDTADLMEAKALLDELA